LAMDDRSIPFVSEKFILQRVFSLAVLCVFWGWAFLPELRRIFLRMPHSSEMVHITILPLTLLLIVFCRRNELLASVTKGTACGVVLIFAGGTLYALASWPFSYGYIRDIAILPVLAGVILVSCGWRILFISFGLLLLIALSIPLGSRLYASLIIRPETYTIKLCAGVMDMMPGIKTSVKGLDIFIERGQDHIVAALGESNRGARLLYAFMTIGVFVGFSHSRSLGRSLLILLLLFPAAFLCNILRYLCLALANIFIVSNPASGFGRNFAAVVSMFAAYGLFAMISSMKVNLFIEASDEEGNSADG